MEEYSFKMLKKLFAEANIDNNFDGLVEYKHTDLPQSNVYGIYKIRQSNRIRQNKMPFDNLDGVLSKLENHDYNMVRLHVLKFTKTYTIGFTDMSVKELIGVIFLPPQD